MKLKIAGLVNDSIVDGPGLRLAIFAQGCPHNCEGCHNTHTHDFMKGYYISFHEIIAVIKKNPLLDGVTFTGGEPFLQAEKFAELAKIIRKPNFSIVTYTGYLYEDLLKDEEHKKLLAQTDILIDGPFILSQKTLDLPFRGSSNQRMIKNI